jgi:hypothetical protein
VVRVYYGPCPVLPHGFTLPLRDCIVFVFALPRHAEDTFAFFVYGRFVASVKIPGPFGRTAFPSSPVC